MTRSTLAVIGSAALLALGTFGARGEPAVTVGRNAESASAEFKFDKVPAPSKDDAGTGAKFTLVDGRPDGNGARLNVLNDGRLPGGDDEPGANFFFAQRADGGRIGIDLGVVADVMQVNTYSWHRDTRGPQVYKLYGADGKAEGFDAAPKAGTDPATKGWTFLARVNTITPNAEPGGQYGVSVAQPEVAKPLGKFRHLLIDASATETDDPFGNTFFSEVDVVAKDDKGELLKIVKADAPAAAVAKTSKAVGGKYEITIDPTGLDADMAKWAEETLRPVCEEWYPKIVEMLPSEGYTAPAKFGIVFKDDMGGTPAAAAGTRVMCNRQWFEKNLKGEAVGAVVHEMVHVVQQYGGRRGRGQVPFWLQEGIPDYIRWFLYEPEKRGAEIRDPSKAKYDAAYRVSGNFLNWATKTYDKQIVMKVNASVRSGKYNDDLWKELTGKTLPELDAEWKAALAKK